MNLAFFPTIVIAALLFAIGYGFGKTRAHVAFGVASWCVAVALATPGILFALYYWHLFDNAVWFYEFRSWPLIELVASGAGFLAGLCYRWFQTKNIGLRFAILPLLVGGLFIPYIKPVIAGVNFQQLVATCPDNVCRQTSSSTCGPASVASILRLFEIRDTERTIAEESFTSAGGTENWYLARAMRRRGLTVSYVTETPPVRELPVPAVAGVILPGDIGHFIAVLGEDEVSYVIGDPSIGRRIIEKSKLHESYDFTGFFMIVDLPTVKKVPKSGNSLSF